MNVMRRLGPMLALAVGALPVPSPSSAQVDLSVSAGAASYDLSGVGTSATAAARVEVALGGVFDVQVGTGFFWYGTQGETQVAMLLPEAGLLAQLPIGIPVYLGVGVGHTLGVKGDNDDDLTLFAAIGLEIEDRGGWAIRPEIRARAVDPWAGTIGDFTLGVRRRLSN